MVSEKEIGKMCIQIWGKSDQIRQTIEECSELITVLAKYGRNVNGSTNKEICEEIADVEIMLNQMRLIFNSDDIDDFRTRKLERLFERLKKEQG